MNNIRQVVRLAHGLAVAVLSHYSGVAMPQGEPTLRQGAAEHRSGNYAAALAIFQTLADKGDAGAQANLGVIYANGYGVRIDPVASVRWFRAAAEQGNAIGAANLGVAYQAGTGGLQKDDVQAAKWYRVAVDKGQISALRNLANLYMSGKGVDLDRREALTLFRRAAEAGDAKSQFQTALMTSHGQGTAPNWNFALHWLIKAADNGDANAIQVLRSSQISDITLAPCDRLGADAEKEQCAVATMRFALFRTEKFGRFMLDAMRGDSQKRFVEEFTEWRKARNLDCQLGDLSSDLETMIGQIARDKDRSACAVRHSVQYEKKQYRQIFDTRTGVESTGYEKEYVEAASRYFDADITIIKDLESRVRRQRGKWYFEVELDFPRLKDAQVSQLLFGFEAGSARVGRLLSVDKPDSASNIEIHGLAIDLDNAKYYRHVNGKWTRASPGSVEGLTIEMNRAYRAKLSSEQNLEKALERGGLAINFGTRKFAFPVPAGYRAFQE